LPDETRLYTGHDYQPGGRAPAWESTVAQQKAENPHITGQDAASFTKLRMAHDITLPMPKLILSALQIDIAGGRLPEAESNGRRYLKIHAMPSRIPPGAEPPVINRDVAG
jgi:hypothetical protein